MPAAGADRSLGGDDRGDDAGDASPSVTGDDKCTLREAIAAVDTDASAGDCAVDATDPAVDTVGFDGLGAGTHVINADDRFILGKVMKIDASGLPDEVRVDGLGASNNVGLEPRADNIMIKGLSITRWGQIGIKIFVDTAADPDDSADGVQVVDNLIGTNAVGDAGFGNLSAGVRVGDGGFEPDNTVIEGNVISGNGNGIQVTGDLTQNTIIRSNLIGTTPAGTAALGNTNGGVSVSGGPDTVQIGQAGAGNVISANGAEGVLLAGVAGDQTTGVTVRDNTIGLGSDGSALGNDESGVAINGDVDGTTIRGNTISDNASSSGHAIAVDDEAATGPDNTTISGNWIGTNPAGTAVVANNGDAVRLASVNGSGTTGATIGGTAAGAGNVIAGTGITVTDAGVTGEQILGNHIGVNTAGTGPLATAGVGVRVIDDDDSVIGLPSGPNLIGATATAGILIESAVTAGTMIQSNLIGIGVGGADIGNVNHGIELQDADGVKIGGTGGEGNTIANNGADGVRVGELGTGNAIVGNEIFDNDGLGIDLEEVGGFGETLNDAGDTDNGANDLQNYVDLAVVAQAGSIRLIGRLESINLKTYLVEVFTNPTPHLSGFGGGEELVDSLEVTTVSGFATINETVAGELAPGEQLSVTVTELTGGSGGDPVQTSEFSPALTNGHCESEPASVGAGVIFGTAAGESIDGTPADDVICARGGNDLLDGGGGDDVMIGETGTDTLDMSAAPQAVVVNLGTGAVAGHGADSAIAVENVIGSPLADILVGDGGPNVLEGGGGPDTLVGGLGNDTLNAADGAADTAINCGGGTDTANADSSAIDPNAIYSSCETINRPAAPTPTPTPAPTPTPTATDTTAPTLTLGGKKKQKSKSKVVVKATCEDEACDLDATGTIKIPKIKNGKPKGSKKFKLKGASQAGVAAGATQKLKLKLDKKAQKKLKKALKKKASKATVEVTATDAAGNATGQTEFKVKVKK